MHVENWIIGYYDKTLNHTTTMWVKIYKKKTILEAFEEAILVQKYILSLKDNKNSETIQASSSKKKFDTLPKLPSAKKD